MDKVTGCLGNAANATLTSAQTAEAIRDISADMSNQKMSDGDRSEVCRLARGGSLAQLRAKGLCP